MAATLITTVASSSNPNLRHEIRLGGDGVVYCTCPAWRFQRKSPAARQCKHMRQSASTIVGFLNRLRSRKAA